ncbi:hypothetical protein AS034_16050 [[Bacillus] enclensis]|uniref:DUF4825 domain-containing protein n=1 Tax=[Bacillus] enclensis TaxID=1402860 RepID=A0A0V8HCX6_9BACI|nr:DUF4825 domain-containing protein [[Bacillus] enclensis]KSU60355.1 hypothetical protein AS034_16050 [[Bacillus] enclensis]SCC23547.1 protein of unknown function [[Bacillus] enclensis]
MKKMKRFALPLLLLLFAAGCSSYQDSEAKNVETLEYADLSGLEQTSLGDNSAVINTVTKLAGGEIPHKIEISSDVLQIKYDLAAYNEKNEKGSEYWYKPDKEQRNAALNSAILFTLVNNLNTVKISFIGETTKEYEFRREELANKLNTSFKSLDEKTYKKYKDAFAEN